MLPRTLVVALALPLVVASTVSLAAPFVADPTATRALPRGHVLTADDIRYPADSALPGQVRPGWTTERTIAAGDALRPPAVRPAAVVRANTPVTVVYARDGVRISLEGIATRHARLGEVAGARIRGTNKLARRLDGIVTGPDTITLGAP